MPSGRFYIGSSSNCRQRMHEHLYGLRNHKHGNSRLQATYNSHDISDFKFEIIEVLHKNSSREERLLREQEYLDHTKCYDRHIGFNLSNSAIAGQFEITDEFRDKIREITSKRWVSGHFDREQARKQAYIMGKANKGKKRSESFCANRREYMLTQSPLLKPVLRSDGTAYISVMEAATANGVSRHTMSKWCQTGRRPKNLELRQFFFKYKEA